MGKECFVPLTGFFFNYEKVNRNFKIDNSDVFIKVRNFHTVMERLGLMT